MAQQTLRNVPPIVFVQDKESAAMAQVGLSHRSFEAGFGAVLGCCLGTLMEGLPWGPGPVPSSSLWLTQPWEAAVSPNI